MPELKVEFPIDDFKQITTDPALAVVDYEISLARNLSSALFHFDQNAQLESGWADAFRRTGPSSYWLHVRTDSVLGDGQGISGDDVVFSLKRMAFLRQKTRNFYVRQFCHRDTLESLDSPCVGLKAKGQEVWIETKDPIAILPQILSSSDTALVPRRALSADGLTIMRPELGTGPYILEKKAQSLRLIANPRNFLYQSNMPQTVRLIQGIETYPDTLVPAFQEGRFDLIPTFSALNVFEWQELLHELGPQASVHATLPFGISLLAFSRHALRRFSSAERQLIVVRLQEEYRRCLREMRQQHLRIPAISMMPASVLGAFTQQEESQMLRQRSELRDDTMPPVRVFMPGYLLRQFAPCVNRNVPQIVFTDQGQAEGMSGVENAVDLIHGIYELSTFDEISALHFMIESNLLHLDGQDPEQWVRSFIQEEDPFLRVAQVKAAHFNSIWGDPRIIPLWHFRIQALVRKPWVLGFSQLSSLNSFYQIRYEP